MLRQVLFTAALTLPLAGPALAQAQEQAPSPNPLIGKNPMTGQAQLTLGTAPYRAEIDMRCRFDTECFDADACSATEFSPSLEGRAGGMTEEDLVLEVDLLSDAGTALLLGVQSGGTMSLSGGTFDARHLLTIAEGGAARYTVHYAEGPMVISYLGICQ